LRAKIIERLDAGRIGVEQSTDAFVLHRPEAKYCNV
jgi:hypothetical protein